MLGIHERRPCRHVSVRKDTGGRNLDDAVVSGPDAGGFQVHAHQRASQGQVGGKFLGQALYVHRVRLCLGARAKAYRTADGFR